MVESSSPFQITQVIANFFKVKSGQPINRYKIEIFEDDQPIDLIADQDLLIKVISIHRKDLIASFGMTHYRAGSTLYSPRIVDEMSFFVTIESTTFRVSIRQTGILEIEDSPEACGFYGRILKSLQGKLKLKQINRKFYNNTSAMELNYRKSKVEVWPGYSTSLRVYNKTPLMNIDLSYKVLREKTIADILNENTGKHIQKLNELVRGMTAVAIHNKISFRVEGFDFEKKLTDTFTRSDGKQISFIEYFKAKHNKDIREKNMPLVVFSKKINGKKEIQYMPPELCVPTGLSEEMKEDRNFMKDLTSKTKPRPEDRLKKTAELISMARNNESTSLILKEWDINLDPQPLTIPAKKADSGNMIFGKDKYEKPIEIKIENNSSLERDSQVKMFKEVELDEWVLLYPQREQRVAERFLDVMKQTIDSYDYPAKKPLLVGINRGDLSSWIEEIKRTSGPKTKMVVLILEGRKKAAPLYDDLKRFFTTERPIPNQVVLTSTANSEKGLRSICNKILSQICAKMGGVPWNVNKLPFSNKPTMIVGIDVFHKINSGKRSVLAFTATMNRFFSQYWSTVRIHEEGQEIGTQLQSALFEALEEFKKVNNCYPASVIVYRDGVSESQRQSVQTIELASLIRGINEKKEMTERPEIIFVCANKRVNAKFFNGDLANPKIPVNNPIPGTIIDSVVTQDSDFYLVSQKTREGSVTPTHYFVLAYYKEIEGTYEHRQEEVVKNLQDIELLTYKLCYLYYNWMGSVKVPAPIHYADRLASFVGERLLGDKPMLPHSRYGQLKCLYFI